MPLTLMEARIHDSRHLVEAGIAGGKGVQRLSVAHKSVERADHPMELSYFNSLEAENASTLLRPCLDVERWIDTIVANRPYASLEELVDHAKNAAAPLQNEEIDSALAHHPRIGERAQGGSTEATLSRDEQSGLNLEDSIMVALNAGNKNYEDRFDRVFLIRAAGRSSEQILAELDRRLENDEATEIREVGEQLQQIAALRLSALF